MSLILDALKKLDRDKSSRRNGTVNIAVEILRPDLPRPGRRMPLYFVGVFLTAVATAAITYIVILKSSPPVPVSPPAPRQQVAPAPLSREQVDDVRDKIGRVPPKVQSPAETRKPAEVKISVTSLGEEETGQDVFSEQPDVAPGGTRKPFEHTPNESAATPTSLRLSGIVWSEEHSKRMAVINGMITTEGSVIEGMKVLEIHPTHIFLLHKGQHFKISLSK